MTSKKISFLKSWNLFQNDQFCNKISSCILYYENYLYFLVCRVLVNNDHQVLVYVYICKKNVQKQTSDGYYFLCIFALLVSIIVVWGTDEDKDC